MTPVIEQVRTPVIAIAGKAGTGKDTVGALIGKAYRVKCVAFADIMKHFVHRCCHIPSSILWGPSEAKDIRVRRLLQHLGTETMREYDPDVWINALIERIQYWETYGHDADNNPLYEDPNPHNTDAIIITDLRFLSELVGIRKYTQSYVIKITRDQNNTNMNETQHAHRSEVELDSIPDALFDEIIDNNGTINALRDKIIPGVDLFLKQIADLR